VPTDVQRRAPRSPELAARAVREIGDRMLSALGLEAAELSVLLTDDARLRALNCEHRGKDRPTDVLAFPLDAPHSRSAAEPRMLGDVAISLDTADRQARARGRSLFAEVRFLLAHGLLHLIGFDHRTASQKRRMVAATRRLVAAAQAANGSNRNGPRAQKSTGPAARASPQRRKRARWRRTPPRAGTPARG